jgi:prophage maintenance system killer protein
MWGPLSFKELLLVAEFFLDVSFDELERAICRPLAEAALRAPFVGIGEIELYPDPVEKAAICCIEIIRHRPLPFGNKRVGYECMREMLARGAYPWATENADDIFEMLNRVEARTISDGQFVRWVKARVGLGEWLRYRGEATA